MTSPATPPDFAQRDRAVIAILLIATFVVILNETLLNVALPRLMAELSVDAVTVQWLATAFMLTMAVVIPITGFLLERLPTRTVFFTAMTLFSVGTLLAGCAPGFTVLLLARIVQASGTAIMLPLLMTTVMTLVPEGRRGAIMGNISIVISVAPALGPTISGLILQVASWRMLFLFVLPIALAALAYGARTLKNVGDTRDAPLDVVSVPLSALGFGSVVYGLNQASGPAGLGNPVVTWSLGLAALSLLLFVWRQFVLQRQDRPLLDLRTFRFPAFTLSVVLMMIAMMALFGGMILLPLYLQNIRGLTTLQTGLLLLPGGLLMGLLAPTVGKLFDKYGPRPLVLPGTVLMTLVLWGLGSITALTPVWWLLALHLILSIGLALLFTPTFTSALGALPPHLYSHGSALLGTTQQVAGAAGTALLITVMTTRTAALVKDGAALNLAQMGGLHDAFGVATLISIAAIVLALFLRHTPHAEGEPHGQPQPTD